jgi:hypothetical protein
MTFQNIDLSFWNTLYIYGWMDGCKERRKKDESKEGKMTKGSNHKFSTDLTYHHHHQQLCFLSFFKIYPYSSPVFSSLLFVFLYLFLFYSSLSFFFFSYFIIIFFHPPLFFFNVLYNKLIRYNTKGLQRTPSTFIMG